MSHTEEAVRAGLALTPAYYRAVRRDAQGPDKVDPAVNYPAPERTSRDPWPAGLDMPGPVAGIKRVAEAHGWSARVLYSVGCHPHGTTGRPTAVASWFGVQMLHPESRARVVATYNGRSSTWSTVHLMTRGEITSQGSITDAHEFVMLAGRVLELRSWVAARITQRERIAAERASRRPPRESKAGTSKRRESGG